MNIYFLHNLMAFTEIKYAFIKFKIHYSLLKCINNPFYSIHLDLTYNIRDLNSRFIYQQISFSQHTK